MGLFPIRERVMTTAHELAAALEREACGHACQCTGCNNIRQAARLLRELEAVRREALQCLYAVEGNGRPYGSCHEKDCFARLGAALCAVSETLRGVGGGT